MQQRYFSTIGVLVLKSGTIWNSESEIFGQNDINGYGKKPMKFYAFLYIKIYVINNLLLFVNKNR